MKNKAKKIQAGLYEYRGFEIEKNEGVPSGYYASWLVLGYRYLHAGTLKRAKEKIDERLDSSSNH